MGNSISFINERRRSDARACRVIHLRDAGTPITSGSDWCQRTDAVLNGNGAVDWVYEEELDVRSNYFWSPDSNRNSRFFRWMRAMFPSIPITDWIPLHPTVDKQRYPQPGDPKPSGACRQSSTQRGGKPLWIKLPPSAFKSEATTIFRASAGSIRKTVWDRNALAGS